MVLPMTTCMCLAWVTAVYTSVLTECYILITEVGIGEVVHTKGAMLSKLKSKLESNGWWSSKQ